MPKKTERDEINPNMDGDWFRQAIRDKGETQRKMARYLDMDPSAVSLLLDGKRRLQLDHAEKIARFLGRPVAEILHRAGLEVERQAGGGMPERRIPISERVDPAGELLPAIVASSVSVPGTTPPDARAARMENGFAPGGAIVYEKPAGVAIEAIGRLSVVTVRDGKTYMGIPTSSHERGRFNVSLPRGSLDEVDLEAATPVLWIRP